MIQVEKYTQRKQLLKLPNHMNDMIVTGIIDCHWNALKKYLEHPCTITVVIDDFFNSIRKFISGDFISTSLQEVSYVWYFVILT